MITLDTSVLIAWAETADVHHAQAVADLTALADVQIYASPITLAEFFVFPARRGALKAARDMVDDLGVMQVPFDAETPHRLAQIRAETALKMPDCCVLLAAQQSGAAVLTYDDRLRRAAGKAGVGTAQL